MTDRDFPLVGMLVCGDRHWQDKGAIRREMIRFHRDSTVISGGAPGADQLADMVARQLGMHSYVEPAHWRHDAFCEPDCEQPVGRSAGMIRNEKMLQKLLTLAGPGERDNIVVLAFHPDLRQSKGTRNMILLARKEGVQVEVYSR